MTTQFALDLRLARRKTGLTQRDCAHLLATKPAKFAALEQGGRLPSLVEICTLSQIYGRSFESLFGEIMEQARIDLQARLENIPTNVRQCVSTANRAATLQKLARRLEVEIAYHGT